MEGVFVLSVLATCLDIWLDLGRIAKQTNQYISVYGRSGILLPVLASSDVWQLVNEVLQSVDEASALRFVDTQVQQANLVAVTVRPHA